MGPQNRTHLSAPVRPCHFSPGSHGVGGLLSCLGGGVDCPGSCRSDGASWCRTGGVGLPGLAWGEEGRDGIQEELHRFLFCYSTFIQRKSFHFRI